jgi:DNA integrity scanning protein DisA with diadenylate cyclase activity
MYVGQALHNLTPKASTYMAETVLPILFDKTSSVDLNTRHGAVLAIAEILHGLAIVVEQSDRTIQDVTGKF